MTGREDEIDRDIRFYHMPVELHVQPAEAQKYLARYFGDSVDVMRVANSSGEWGSHLLRAVLSIAVEEDVEAQVDIIPRLVGELIAQPQQLAEFAGISMQDAALARSRMALFDARRFSDAEHVSLGQFVERWR